MNNPLENLTRKEWALWICSLLEVFVSNILSEYIGFLTLVAACIGVTSLVFAAKGNVWSQVLMVVFSTVYVTTSFLAVALTMLRSSYYAVGYAGVSQKLITKKTFLRSDTI